MQAIEYSLTEALAALAAGKKQIAQAILTGVIKEDSRNALAWLYLAVTLPRDGAIQALRRVLILDPENSVAGRNLERLRQAELELEFKDLYPEPQITPYFEPTPQLFEFEPPTINLREIHKAADFGDETGTIPFAFSFLARAVEKSIYRPNVSVTLADLFSKKEMELLQESLPPLAKPTPLAPPRFTAPLTPPIALAPVQPVVAPALTDLPKPVKTLTPSFANAQLALSRLPVQPPPRVVSEQLTRPLTRMPRLEERPRYMLGTTPRPMLGFTGLGIIIFLTLCLAIFIVAVWLFMI